MSARFEFLLALVLCLLALGVARNASAAAELKVICPTASHEGKPVAADPWCAGQYLGVPSGSMLVRTAPTNSPTWGDAAHRWARFDSLPGGALVEGCAADVAAQSPIETCSAWAFFAKPAPVTGSGSAVLSWAAVTQYTDGTTIAAPVTYSALRGPKGGPYSQLAGSLAALSYTASGLAPGEHCFTLLAHVGGVPSAPSGEACKTITAAAPKSTTLKVK